MDQHLSPSEYYTRQATDRLTFFLLGAALGALVA